MHNDTYCFHWSPVEGLRAECYENFIICDSYIIDISVNNWFCMNETMLYRSNKALPYWSLFFSFSNFEDLRFCLKWVRFVEVCVQHLQAKYDYTIYSMFQPLKKAVRMMGAPNLIADNVEYGLSYSVISYLKKLSQQVMLKQKSSKNLF